jgi:CspA family cold shock protein
MSRCKGVVKWFNGVAGYGFIRYEGKDVFVHYTELKMFARGGEAVDFDLREGPNGLFALEVRPCP